MMKYQFELLLQDIFQSAIWIGVSCKTKLIGKEQYLATTHTKFGNIFLLLEDNRSVLFCLIFQNLVQNIKIPAVGWDDENGCPSLFCILHIHLIIFIIYNKI